MFPPVHRETANMPPLDRDDLDGKLSVAASPAIPKLSLLRSKSDGDAIISTRTKKNSFASKKTKSSDSHNSNTDNESPIMDNSAASHEDQARMSGVSFAQETAAAATKDRRRRHSEDTSDIKRRSRRSRTPDGRVKSFPMNEPRNKRRSTRANISSSEAEKARAEVLTASRRGRSTSTSRRRDTSKTKLRELTDSSDKSVKKQTRSKSVPSLGNSEHSRDVVKKEDEQTRERRTSDTRESNNSKNTSINQQNRPLEESGENVSVAIEALICTGKVEWARL